VLAQIPDVQKAPKIERRADCITDPVERLRYLRLMATPESKRRFPNAWNRVKRSAVWIVLAGALAIAPWSRPKGEAASAPKLSPSITTTSPTTSRGTTPERVWRVEKSGATEIYSNGLRIDTAPQVSNRPRPHYPIFDLEGGTLAHRTGSAPVGIVYHTTESLIAPFEEDQNRRLKQLGRNVLDLIRREHAYHYMIDRFGRVFAAVAESDAANHAGNSVWADAQGIYVNLNDSFLGVAFEAQTGAMEEVTPAQVASAKALTGMLRSRYEIAATNCVTHAQVSVNPDNMRIASHTDWASGFPFAAIGLPDNYATPLASMTAFGFDYDSVFLEVAGRRWHGLDLADEQVSSRATAEGITVARYRAGLKRRYKEIALALKETQAGEAIQKSEVVK
jgi:N-acetylmuramoyl-L-alanine amidase